MTRKDASLSNITFLADHALNDYVSLDTSQLRFEGILRFDSANEIALGNARRHAEFPRTGNAGWLNSRSRAFCLAKNLYRRSIFKLEAERNPGTDLHWLSIDEGRLVLPFSYCL